MLRAADSHNTRYDKVLAYSHLGVGQALIKLDQPRAALAQQLKGVEILRATVKADARNDVAIYDAAFSMGEASTTLIVLGELPAAQALLTESLSILSRAQGISDPEINSSKQVLGLNYFRLGVLHAMQAQGPVWRRANRAGAARNPANGSRWPSRSLRPGMPEGTSQWESISRYSRCRYSAAKGGFRSAGCAAGLLSRGRSAPILGCTGAAQAPRLKRFYESRSLRRAPVR